MKHHHWLSVVMTAFVFCAVAMPCCHAQDIDPDKEKEIRKMLELTGASKMGTQVINQMLDAMTAGKKTSAEFVARVKKKIKMDELIEMMIPIYDRYYSTEDLKAVNAFYSSAAGKKLIESLPLVMKDSMKAGQVWGAKIGKTIAEEMQAEDDIK